MTTVYDTSNTDRLDDHFAKRRDQEIALAAEAARAEHEVKTGALRNERIRRTGVAALLVGAGVGLACIGASFIVAADKERVVYRDVPGPERVVIKEVPAPLPPVAKAVPLPPARPPAESPYTAKTPEEKPFTEKPEYKGANYRGRIVKSRDGRALSFKDGKDFFPCSWNSTTRECPDNPDAAIDSDAYAGDLGMCTPEKGQTDLWDCVAFHNGQEIEIKQKPFVKPPWHDTQVDTPTTDATNMVNVAVDVAGTSVTAMVDTGCSFPMSMPKTLADKLLDKGLATPVSSSRVTLADGSTVKADVIEVNAITVGGRVLHNVVTSVALSDNAPILLGLGALNRLGAFKIEDGAIIFTGEQPA